MPTVAAYAGVTGAEKGDAEPAHYPQLSSYATLLRAGLGELRMPNSALEAVHGTTHEPMRVAAILGALGVVFGDIATSPLYALKEAATAASHGGALTPDTVLGVLSLILWSLIIVIALKYCAFILRADNHGEGGIIALLALLDARHIQPGTWRVYLVRPSFTPTISLHTDPREQHGPSGSDQARKRA